MNQKKWVPYTIRIPAETHKEAKRNAASEHRSMNAYIVRSIEKRNEAKR
jgi:predicted HicB family RNase H-like nuclease